MTIEVIRSIRSFGGHYSSITEFFSAHDQAGAGVTRLQNYEAYLFSGVGWHGSFEVVTDQNGNTGRVVGGAINGTIIIDRAVGNFNVGDVLTSTQGSITITSSADFAILIGELHGDWPAGLDDAIDCKIQGNQNSYPELRVEASARHRGRPLNTASMFYLAPSAGPALLRNDIDNFRLRDIAISCQSGGGFVVGRGTRLINPAVYAADGALAAYSEIGQSSWIVNGSNYAQTPVGYSILDDSTDSGQKLLSCADWASQNSFSVANLVGSTDAEVINCIGMSSEPGLDSFIGTFTNQNNSNNASADSSAPGALPVYNASPLFENESLYLKHLSAADTSIITQGQNLTDYLSNFFIQNPYINFDYDYDLRPQSGPWSIGPDHPTSQPPSGSIDGVISGIVGAGIYGATSIEASMGGVILGMAGGEINASVNEALGEISGFFPSFLTSSGLQLPAGITGEITATVVGDGQMFGIIKGVSGVFYGEHLPALTGAMDGVIPGLRGCLFDGEMFGVISGFKLAHPTPVFSGAVSNYTATLKNISRIPSSVVIVSPDKCQLEAGTAPCYAVGAPCYNTLATCKYKQAYSPEKTDELYCLNDVPVNVGGITRPYVKAIKISALEIVTSKSTISNSSAKITFYDEPDSDYAVDKYRIDDGTRLAPSGVEQIKTSGTYWGKWIARNKHFKGRRLSVFKGFTDGVADNIHDYIEDFKGVISDVEIGKNGTITISANGLLQLADKVEIPRQTDGKLWSSIDKSDDDIVLAPWTGVDSKVTPYESKYSSKLIKIGSEIISYQGVTVDQLTGATTLSGISRGAHNQYGWDLPQNHEKDEQVVEVEFFSGNPIDIMLELIKIAGVLDDEINGPTFEFAKNEGVGNVFFAAVIDSKIKIKELLKELRIQTGTHIWQDETQRISIRYMAPLPPWQAYRRISDSSNIINMSSSLDVGSKSRITRSILYYNHMPGGDIKKPEGFLFATAYRSSEAEHEYGYGEAVDGPQIFSRWLWRTHGVDGYIYDLMSNIVETRVDGAKKIKFSLELKDSQLALGEIFEVEMSESVDDSGAARVSRFMVIRRESAGRGRYNYTAEATKLDGRWLMIAPDDFPENWVDGDDYTKKYGCISDDNGNAPDGEPGYKLAR